MSPTSIAPDVIVRARWVIRNATDPVLHAHGVAVGGGRVVDIAPFETLRRRYPEAERRGGERFAMMPGFVNALKALAAHHEISLGNLLEGIALFAFEGLSPFGSSDSQDRLKKICDAYGLKLKSHDSPLQDPSR